jgi:Mannosyltransferase putative
MFWVKCVSSDRPQPFFRSPSSLLSLVPPAVMKTHVAGFGRLLTIPRIAVALLIYTTFIYFAILSLTETSHSAITPAHKRALDLLASDQGQFIIENLQKISDRIREDEEVKVPSSEQEDSQERVAYDSVARNTDPNHTKAHLQFWQNLAPKAIETYKHDWTKFISHLSPYSSFQNNYQGTGIVFTAGNKDTLNRTLTIISIMRDYGCNLPVEVWHLADETPSARETKQLETLNAVSKDLSDPNLVRPAQKKRDAEKQ